MSKNNNRKDAAAKISKTKLYGAEEAIALAKEVAFAKFDETFEY